MRSFVTISLVLLALVLAACSSAPYDQTGGRAIGQVRNNLGDTYHLDAASLTANWTFTRDTDVVLSFDDGTLTFDGNALQPGCYSDSVTDGDVLEIDDAHNVSFASPETDASCRAFPR